MLHLSPLSALPVNELVLNHSAVSVKVLRLDLVHPVVSGNKWFKLKHYLDDAVLQGKKMVITFGGAWSNHIVATAAACEAVGLTSVGIIRGERPGTLSATLQTAAGYGMKLIFVSRDDYRQRSFSTQVSALLTADHVYVVDEGGYGEKGMLGASEILSTRFADTFSCNRPGSDFSSTDSEDYDYVIAGVGTGTTLAGLAYALGGKANAIGISVLKNNHGLSAAVQSLLPESLHASFNIIHDFHFGGYAKTTPELIGFMNAWYREYGIPSDFVYTAKVFYAVDQLMRSEFFPAGSKLLVVHTGGLQGNASLPKGTLIF